MRVHRITGGAASGGPPGSLCGCICYICFHLFSRAQGLCRKVSVVFSLPLTKLLHTPDSRSTVWLDVALIHWLDMDWGFDRKINQTFDCSVSDCLCASASTHKRNLEELFPKGTPAGCAEGRKEKVPQLCVLLGPGAPSDQPHSCVLSRGLRFQTRAHSALWRLEMTGSHA